MNSWLAAAGIWAQYVTIQPNDHFLIQNNQDYTAGIWIMALLARRMLKMKSF